MDGDLIVGPFGRLLPRPTTSSSNSGLPPPPQEAAAAEAAAAKMVPREPFSKDVPISSDPFDPAAPKLPSVSHILGGHGYHDLPLADREAAKRGLSVYHRPSYSNDGPGATLPGVPPLFRPSFAPQPIPTHYGPGSRGIPPVNPFSHPPPYEDQASRLQAVSSFFTRSDGRLSSDPDTPPEHPRAPRVIREEEIPGKGLCYIYDDGTYCPKVVNGDSVNPQWGITKAGKPRKRLAQACSTCREKKIRCDPGSGASKCSQCLKFNRECRFDQQQQQQQPNGTRSNPRSPSTSTTNSPALEAGSNPSPTFHRDSAASTDLSLLVAPSSKTSIDIGHSTSSSPFLNQTTDADRREHPLHPAKRRKPSVLGNEANLESVSSSQHVPATKERSNVTINDEANLPVLASPMWDQDPFEFDREMTEYYLHQYFSKINYTTYCMFPKKPFMDWVRDCRDKNRWDRMLLYAMMAHGSIFAANPRKHADGKTFSRIAHHAIGQSAGEFNLQVVQTRLILALYDFSQGSAARAWDFTGSAVRAACGMKLNVEEGVTDIKDDDVLEYGLNKATLIECRRRTFWSAYIMDRFNGFCSGHLAMFHNEDCLLRLPCNERMYEEGNIPMTPFFDNRKIDPQQFVYSDTNAPGMMAYLVQIASIWGEVLARTYRSRYQPPAAWGEPFEDFYQLTVARLDAWERSLGAHLRCSPGNIDRAGQSGHLGTYGALHTLYHCTMMKLNRHARYDRMKPQNVDRNVKCAYEHACKTLDTMKAIAKHNRVNQGGQFGFAVSSPFTGFAVLTAIDILTSTGSMADLLNPNSRSIELLAGGIDVMTELSEHWSSAKTQLKLIERRFEDLMATVQSHGLPQHTRVAAFFSREPLETTFGLEHDLIYALPKKRYLQALGWASKEGDDMLEVLKRGSSVNTVPLSATTI